jgi:hypothetical protein
MLDPIDPVSPACNARGMDEPRSDLKRALGAPHPAGQRLTRASDDALADEIDPVLGEVESLLRQLSSACYSLAHAVVAQTPGVEPVWRRYSERDSGLSHEQQAHALSTLHELGASISASARRCRAARDVLRPLTAAMVDAPGAGGRDRDPKPLTAA